jgi:hypothetical protein
VLYVCIPVHDEAATIGLLLWRLRTVLQETGRDYEVVVYDDASTDATAEVLAPYARTLPLTVLGGPGAPRRGRTGATAALLRHVAATSRYPRRDACVVLQGDFTDRAEDVPALLPAFDQGADVVVGRRAADAAQPQAERRLRRLAPWVLRPLVRVEGVDDLLGGPRLFRTATVRDLVRARGAAPIAEAEGWAGVAELLAAVVPFARRVAVVDTLGRYDVRQRPSRIDLAVELRGLARYAWRARGTHARPSVTSPRAGSRAGLAVPDADSALAPTPDTPSGADDLTRPERPRRARPKRATGVSAEGILPPDTNLTAQPHHSDGAGEHAHPPAAMLDRSPGPGRQRRSRVPAGGEMPAPRVRALVHTPTPRQTARAADAPDAGQPAPVELPPLGPDGRLPADAADSHTRPTAVEPSEADGADPPTTRRRKRRPRRRGREGDTAGADDATLARDDPALGTAGRPTPEIRTATWQLGTPPSRRAISPTSRRAWRASDAGAVAPGGGAAGGHRV